MPVLPSAPVCANERFMVVFHPTDMGHGLQPVPSVFGLQPVPIPHGLRRYALIFLQGDFSEEEANLFVIDLLDNMHIPCAREYFSRFDDGPVEVTSQCITTDLTAENVATEALRFAFDHYSVAEFCDKYDFYI
jgi:hypothetical protein